MKNLDIIPLDLYNIEFLINQGMYLHIEWLVENRVSKGRDVPRHVPGQTRTGRPFVPLSRDKKNSLSRCPFVPGQKSFACPAVPLSRDKGKCKNPGTNSSVPGHNHFLFCTLIAFFDLFLLLH